MNLRASTVDAVADQLRRELLRGAIPPGSRMLPNDLARRFSVSHIPVREALRRLEAEGLVVTSPQRATYAAEIGLGDLAGTYELRRIVEGEFAWRSASHRSAADLERAQAAWHELETAEPYSDEFFAGHRELHWALMLPAASPVTRRLLDQVWLAVDRYLAVVVARNSSYASAEQVKAMLAEHATLLNAYERGNADALRSRLVKHLSRTEDRLRAAYQQLVADDPDLSEWLQLSESGAES